MSVALRNDLGCQRGSTKARGYKNIVMLEADSWLSEHMEFYSRFYKCIRVAEEIGRQLSVPAALRPYSSLCADSF